MNWEAIGAVGELIGATGVIVSLVYLALQIRHNSVLLERNVEQDRLQAAILSANYGAEFMQRIALDDDVARLWIQGMREPGQLEPLDERRFDLLMLAQIIQLDVNFYLARSGSLDPQVAGIWSTVLDSWIVHPRFAALCEAGGIAGVITPSFYERIRTRQAELGRTVAPPAKGRGA